MNGGISSKRSFLLTEIWFPRDIATREIFQVCIEGKGVGGETRSIWI